MLWIVACVVVANLAFRVYLLRRPIEWSKGDEGTYAGIVSALREHGFGAFRKMGRDFAGEQGFWGMSPPTRIVPVVLASLLHRWTHDDRKSMAWVATASGCVAPVLAACIGWHLSGYMAAFAGALLASSQPISLGLGRRGLIDIPALTSQLAVFAVACLGPGYWWATSVVLVMAGLARESARTTLPALSVALGIVYGWPWSTVALSVVTAVVVYCAALWGITGRWPWQYPSAFVNRFIKGLKNKPGGYPWQHCRGGAHRLFVNLLQLSPLVVVVALWGSGVNRTVLGLAIVTAIVLASYGLPWLDQQIRSASIADSILRLAAAIVAPLWVLPSLVACDLYVWYRAWGRGAVYDPTTSNLGRALAMLPRELPYPRGGYEQDPLPLVEDIPLLERLILDEPGIPELRFRVAQAYQEAGELKLAFEQYAEYVRSVGGGYGEKAFWSLYQMGDIHLRMGNDQQALQVWQAAYECRRTRAEPVVAISRWYNDHGLPEMGLLIAEKAMSMRPDPDDRLGVDLLCYGGSTAEAECARACKISARQRGIDQDPESIS